MPKFTYPTDSVTVDLGDGVERELRYSMGSMRRLKKLFGVAGQGLSEVLAGVNEEKFPEILFEGLVDRAGIADADALADLIQLGAVTYLAGQLTAAFAESMPKADLEAKNDQTSQPVN